MSINRYSLLVANQKNFRIYHHQTGRCFVGSSGGKDNEILDESERVDSMAYQVFVSCLCSSI